MNAVKDREEKTEKLFNFRPAFFAAVFLCLGIYVAYRYTFEGISVWWVILPFPCFLAPVFFCKDKKTFRNRALALLLLAAAFGIGFISFRNQMTDFADCPAYQGNQWVIGTVVDKADGAEDETKLVLRNVYVGSDPQEGIVNAYLPTSFCENIEISDRVLIRGYVRSDTRYFSEYGFRANEISDKMRLVLFNAKSCEKIEREFDLFLWIRGRMEKAAYAGMDETPAAVTIAVLTGRTAGIDEGLLENIRYGGIAHIFAVSGLHVGALYGFCLFLFRKTGLKRLSKPLRFVLLAGILLFYAGVCGFTPSIIRAVVICLSAYFASLLGINSDLLQALGLAAIVILLCTPTALFEVGFQLSFLSCLGIALLAKRIGHVCDEVCFRVRSLFPKRLTRSQREALLRGDTLPPTLGERIRKNTVSLLSSSLGAQIATAPILLSAFDYLSGWSMLLNFIFIPFIGAVFSVLLAFVILASILPIGISAVVLYLPSLIWSTALLVFEIADFSTFALAGMQLSGGSCVCYYSGALFLSDKWNLPKKLKIALAAVCFLAFAVTVVALNA